MACSTTPMILQNVKNVKTNIIPLKFSNVSQFQNRRKINAADIIRMPCQFFDLNLLHCIIFWNVSIHKISNIILQIQINSTLLIVVKQLYPQTTNTAQFFNFDSKWKNKGEVCNDVSVYSRQNNAATVVFYRRVYSPWFLPTSVSE